MMLCCCNKTKPVIGILVYTCADGDDPATATVTDPNGANVPCSGTYNSGQTQLKFTPTVDGQYSITVSASNHYSRTFSVTYTTGETVPNPTVYLVMQTIMVCVTAICSHSGSAGAVVTVAGGISGSCTTAAGSDGTCCTVDISDPGNGLVAPPDYTISVSQYRYVTQTTSYSFAKHTQQCGVTVQLTTPSDCYQCCSRACEIPYNAQNMVLTTPWGGSIPIALGATYATYANAETSCEPSPINTTVEITYSCSNQSYYPVISMYFTRSCSTGAYYGNASNNPANGPSIGTGIVFDSVSCPDAGMFSASGHVGSDDINYTSAGETIYVYFAGQYTLTEQPCGSYGDPPVSGQSLTTVEPYHVEPIQSALRTAPYAELVVARFQEWVGWTEQSPVPTIVYNKGGDACVLNGVRVVNLHNVGREMGSYLHYIVTHYYDLPEWVFFCQGTTASGTEFYGRIGLQYRDSTSLSKEYQPHFPSEDVKALDLVEYHGYYEVRYGCAAYVGGRLPEVNGLWLRAVWDQWFTCEPPEDWTFGYANEWAVPSFRITDRPLAFWLYAWDLIQRDDMQAEMTVGSSWAWELIAKYVFGDAKEYPVRVP